MNGGAIITLKVAYWHFSDLPKLPDDVRSLGWTGSHRRTVKTTRLLGEGLNVGCAAADNFKKLQITIFARLADTQQNSTAIRVRIAPHPSTRLANLP
jgi:hypothetical protein